VLGAQVSWEAGHALAKTAGALFVEASAKSGAAVATAFEELVLRVLEAPGSAAHAYATPGGGGAMLQQQQQGGGGAVRLGSSAPGPSQAYCAC
jgi:hypothetical protein